MKHTISMLVDNEPGVLARISGLFSARGCNIESLCVTETVDPMVSQITLVTSGEGWMIDTVLERLKCMINVVRVEDLTELSHIQRELTLLRIEVNQETKAEVLRMVEIFRAKIVDVGPKSYMLELTGDRDKINAFLELLKPIGVKEIVRTGTLAMAREVQNFKKPRKRAAV
ncbi:MAG TPA: acetolactate synthase small subunit [Thermodesulfobacteriota bacterium]|nr:acetolactate synthase small subunit [Thermodesulfobacteriota bacterium]